MKNQPQLIVPLTGMDRDTHPSRLKENTYSFAKNISLEDSSGNGLPLVQNEPSNLLCQNFKDSFNYNGKNLGDFKDYKIVGYRFNSTIGRTYFFFVNNNPASEFYQTSVIGYISRHVVEFDSNDYDAECGCISIKVLDEPLENQTQESLCEFKVIAEDSCNKCLNFSLDNPIFERNIRFKNEQCGRRMYWTDRVNPPRYIDLDIIENTNWKENIYHHTGNNVCSQENIEETCFDCEKIKMIPDYSIPCILPKDIVLGGSLKLGTYEFLIAYCDEEGNELSNYFSHTNPINLFDYNNVTMNQTELDRVTSYAISLKVSNLDQDFHFYKVAVIQHTEVNGEQSEFIEGIHPITDETILYTSERNKKRTTLNKILVRRVKVQSVEQMIDSNGYLFMAGIKNKPVLNLQPIVNLLGPYFKWTSIIGKEDFYKNGINASTYRSYMRDEVYPLSITFGMNDGTETNDFILIGRAPTPTETRNIADRFLDLYDPVTGLPNPNPHIPNPYYEGDNFNMLSIKSGKNACGGNERKYKWQFENTAQLKGTSSLLPRCTTKEEQQEYIDGLGSNVFMQSASKTCTIPEMFDSNGVQLNKETNFQIKIDGDYRSPQVFYDYVSERIDRYTEPTDQLYSPEIALLFNKSRYTDFHCSTTSSCNCIDRDLLSNDVILTEFEIDLSQPATVTYLPNIEYEDLNYIETQFPEGLRDEDYSLSSKFIKQNYGASIHTRPKRLVGNSCSEPFNLKIYQDTDISNEEGFVMPIQGTRLTDWKSGLLDDRYISTPVPKFNYLISYQFQSGEGLEREDYAHCRRAREFWNILRADISFEDRINKSALWTRTQDISSHPYIQINTQPTSTLNINYEGEGIDNEGVLTKLNDVAYNKLGKIRVSIYEDCAPETGTVSPLKVYILDTGTLLNLQTELGRTSGRFYIVVDTPIIKLSHYKADFIRWFGFSEEVQGIDGQEVPAHFRFNERYTAYSSVLGYDTEFVRFMNVTPEGGPGGANSGDGCNSSTYSFQEHKWWNISGGGFPSWVYIDYGNYNLEDDKSYITAGTDFSLMIIQRGLEIDYTTYTAAYATVEKIEEYQRDCYYEDLDEKICEGKPFEEGIFGYVESVEEYPDNAELYDSSRLNLTEEIFDSTLNQYKINNPEWKDLMYSDGIVTAKDIFMSNFSKLEIDEYGETSLKFLSDRAQFNCRPIRHFKFPSNNVSPFLYTNEKLDWQNTFIFPLGVTIDKGIINIFLDLAVKTGLLNKSQRNSIEYFKIKRGDRTLEKSILSKGLLTDLIKYREPISHEDRLFPNFPYNSLKKHELLSRDGYIVKHPYVGKYNNKFVFNAPEVEMSMNLNPTEVTIEGYQYGVSEAQIDQVQDHAKMVLLSQTAIDTADSLAKTESTFEVLSKVAELGIGAAQASSGGGFSGFSGLVAGAAAGAMVGMVMALRSPMIKDRTAELRNKWIDIFKTKGLGENFAHYISSVGFYNNYSNKTVENSRLRRVVKSRILSDGNYNINYPTDNGYMKINNVDREKSLFLFLGSSETRDGIRYLESFQNIDDSSLEPTATARREIFSQNIANLYASVKVWKSDQYGTIGNIKWIDITGCHYLTDSEESTFFGGDTFITRYGYKRKYNFFLVSEMLQSDFTPFKYSYYFNVGKPKYFIDYETEGKAYGKSLITTPSSSWKLFPGGGVEKGNYITNGMFFHYWYGIPYFFVESTVNCWNRYAGNEPWENFYPNIGDYMAWTQQKLVSIRKPNVFKYNYVYSMSGTPKNNNFLPNNFVEKFYNCTNNSPNGIMYSSPDASEKQKVDPWLVYKNFDFYNFPTSNGKLIDLLNIESTQILGLFENQVSMFNAIDTLRERVTPETKELGTGGIFAQRPIDFHRTDLGYGGTQHKTAVSCEFGHFWVDARRGQVHQVDPNGKDLTEITMGLRNWFKEHLPFKILKGKIDGLLDLDLDNPFKNIGISMGYDSRFKRIFITKLDYIVKPNYIGNIEFIFREGKGTPDVDLDFLSVNKYLRVKDVEGLEFAGQEVDFDNRTIFEPAHFTLAYSPLFKTWISYYDFTPGFYINYDNYFSTGFNSPQGASIWSHLLTNKSFGVFYGKKYPWKIEVPTKEQYAQKIISNVEFWLDSIRYHNSYDYAINIKLGFDNAVIYNHTNSSGQLNLITREVNNRYQQTQYPKVANNQTDILVTYDEGKWSFNDFYNRTENVHGNVPLWNYDRNAIDKFENSRALTFRQRWLDRVRGDWFLIRFEGGSDTRFKQMFKWLVPQDNVVM